MSVALDLGAHAFRSLRGSHAGLVARRSRAVAAWLSNGTLQQSWLERNRIPFFPCEEHLALVGDQADELAQLFSVPCQDLLPDGSIPYADAVARQLIALLVEALLPPASAEGEICCFIQPAHVHESEPTDAELIRRLEFSLRQIRLRGYEPSPLNPALALALAEMEPEKFTGIAISTGASGCDLALTHRGNGTGVLRTARGGRWIDEELARRTGRIGHDLFGERIFDLERARRRKEGISLAAPATIDEQLVVDLHRQVAGDLVQGVEQLIEVNPLLVRFSQPLTIVLGGGLSRAAGFAALLREQVARRFTADVVGTVRTADESELTIIRGGLIQATLMTQSRQAA